MVSVHTGICVRKLFAICTTSNLSLCSAFLGANTPRIGTNKSTMKICAFYKHQLRLDIKKPGSLPVVLQRTEGQERSQCRSLNQKPRLLSVLRVPQSPPKLDQERLARPSPMLFHLLSNSTHPCSSDMYDPESVGKWDVNQKQGPNVQIHREATGTL